MSATPRPPDETGCRARLVWDPLFLEYDFGPQHPLRPERLRHGLDLLETAGLWRPESETLTPRQPARAELELVHSRDYVNFVEWVDAGSDVDESLLQVHGLGPGDNPAFPGVHRTSALIAGGTLDAARGIMAGQFDHVFNPAGGLHHAMRARASGFCVYNDAAVAIAALLREHEARVLYLDFDAHHGDGVQALFYDEPRVLTFSIHETGRHLFPGTGEVLELGEGAGLGYSVNAPMEPFTQDESWLAAVHGLVPALAEGFRPDFVVSQHGCDSHHWDPLTHLAITTRAMAEQARLAHELAHRYCGGRWIGLGGGGYDFRRVVPRMYALVFAQMTGRPLPAEVPEAWRQRWSGTGRDPLPTAFVDPEAEFPPINRAGEVAERNAETVARARQATLPTVVRHAFPAVRRFAPGSSVPDLIQELGQAPVSRSANLDTERGTVLLRDWAPASLVQRLRPDPGLLTFTRSPEREHQLLTRIAGLRQCALSVAHTPDGVIVGQVTLARGEYWWADLPSVWEISVEVSRDWRHLGLAGKLLDFVCQAPEIERLILIALGLSWCWDVDQEEISVYAYRDVIRQLFSRIGFQEERTAEPNIGMRPANILLARVGSDVPLDHQQLFRAALLSPPGRR